MSLHSILYEFDLNRAVMCISAPGLKVTNLEQVKMEHHYRLLRRSVTTRLLAESMNTLSVWGTVPDEEEDYDWAKAAITRLSLMGKNPTSHGLRMVIHEFESREVLRRCLMGTFTTLAET